MLNVVDRMYLNAMCRIVCWKERAKELWEEEKGSTSTVVIEIVLIGMVLVLGFLFRHAIGELFVKLWNGLVKFKNEDTQVDNLNDLMDNPFSK